MPTRIAMVAPRAAICANARSTKITPRSTTCTPRYACIPVRIRLAINGQIRNGRISMSLLRPLLRLLERFGQQSNIVIEKLKIVCHLLLTAYGRQINHYFSSRLAGDAVRSLQIEVRLNHDDLAVFPLHQSDEFQGVAGRGRYAGPWLNIAYNINAKMLGEVRQRVVVGDHLPAVIRLHF